LPAICHAILQRICAESQTPVPVVSEKSLIQLAQCDMRGNVRELENLLHRAIALSDGGELSIDCPNEVRTVEQPAPTNCATQTPSNDIPRIDIPQDLQTHLDNQEREILIQVLNEAGFNRTTAANRLGLTLRQIRYRIARLNIRTPQADDAGSD
jgi:two-component system response regulator PilR (NtrC family)